MIFHRLNLQNRLSYFLTKISFKNQGKIATTRHSSIFHFYLKKLFLFDFYEKIIQ